MRRRARLGLATLLLVFVAGAGAAAGAESEAPLSISAYIAQLDALASSIATSNETSRGQLTSSIGRQPYTWRVQTAEGIFDVPAGWLEEDLRAWSSVGDAAARDRLLVRLRALRNDAARFEQPGPDPTRNRALLAEILGGREFLSVHGPTWLDRLQQRVLAFLAALLERLFARSVIPTIDVALVYGLIFLAVIVGVAWTIRWMARDVARDAILSDRVPAAGEEWTERLAAAQSAAAAGRWREAVHLSYWCAVCFLEARGAWRPDRARTPREYLRLLPSASDDLAALTALTRRFELAWYGTEPVGAQAYTDAIATLKKLGCLPA